MSIGYEIIVLGMLIHGAVAFAIGFVWSLIPKKAIGLAAFVLFYIVIAIWYTSTFNLQMLIYSTFFVPYVVVGLVGFAFGFYWLGINGYYKKKESGKMKVLGHE